MTDAFLAKRAPVAASRALRELRRRRLSRDPAATFGWGPARSHLKIWVAPLAIATLN